MSFLIVGMLLVSFGLSYAWWRTVRVYALKQDIFDIRDELFDFAAGNGWLSDVAYQQTREHLNDFAGTARLMSIPFLAFFAVQPRAARGYHRPKSDDPLMDEKIKDTLDKSSHLLHHYLFRCTAIGWLICCLAGFRELRKVASIYIEKLASRWIYSDIDRFGAGAGACGHFHGA